MAKLVLELKNMPKKGDIMIFDGDNFKCVSKESFLSELNSKINNLDTHINNLEKELKGE